MYDIINRASLPGVKTDKWIKSKCITPEYVVERESSSGKETHIIPFGKNIETIKREIKDQQEWQSMVSVGKPDSYNVRETTDEEKRNFVPMIMPFIPHQEKLDSKGNRILSRGLSSMGYDVTLDDKFLLFTNTNSGVVDPKNFDKKCLVDGKITTDETGTYVLIPPNSYLLGVTKEYFRIPKNVVVVALGKSTYARSAIIVNVTPIEPGFEGNVVIEVSNASPIPVKVYANEGISQFVFFESSEDCEVSYADRDGKYQCQTGLKMATV